MDECIFVRQECWIHLEMGNPLTSTPNMEVIHQVWDRLMHVKGFQLTSRIQHSILQIWVCVRNVYANESICEAWVWLDERVQKLNVWICYHMDRFFVLDMKLCASMDYSPGLILWLINKPLWMDISMVIIEEAPHPHLQYPMEFAIVYYSLYITHNNDHLNSYEKIWVIN